MNAFSRLTWRRRERKCLLEVKQAAVTLDRAAMTLDTGGIDDNSFFDKALLIQIRYSFFSQCLSS